MQKTLGAKKRTALIKSKNVGRSSKVGSSLIEGQGGWELTIRGYHWKCDFNFILFSIPLILFEDAAIECGTKIFVF